MIKITDFTKKYGDKTVYENFNLSIEKRMVPLGLCVFFYIKTEKNLK